VNGRIVFEVSRGIVLPDDSTFVEDVNTFGHEILDVDGTSAVSLRPTNQTIRTRRAGALYYPEASMRYTHLSIVDLAISRAKKRVNKMEHLLLGSRNRLERSPDYVRQTNPGDREISDMDVIFDAVDEVSYPALSPRQTFFVLRATDRSNRVEARALRENTQAINGVVQHLRPGETSNAPTVDTIPFAETTIVTDPERRIQFLKHVRQLLPLKVSLLPIDVSTIQNTGFDPSATVRV
jgi:hypothetical protein